jgi:hypothetical protein
MFSYLLLFIRGWKPLARIHPAPVGAVSSREISILSDVFCLH